MAPGANIELTYYILWSLPQGAASFLTAIGSPYRRYRGLFPPAPFQMPPVETGRIIQIQPTKLKQSAPPNAAGGTGRMFFKSNLRHLLTVTP